MSSYKILYSGKDISKNLSEILVSMEFIDRLEGHAGDLSIELADHEAKFMGDWYPETDDKIEVWIGELNCGTFWVDEVENKGDRNGTFCTIKAMSIRSSALLQTKQIKGYKGKSLKQLANEVANSMGLTVKGSIDGIIQDNCIVNNLEFLSDQATKFGYILKIDSGAIVFSRYEDLRKQKSILLFKENVVSWSVKDKAIGRYSKCTCKHYDAQKKTIYSGIATLPITGGEATIWEEVKSNSDAKERAKDWLTDKNKQQADIELELMGDERLLAGIRIEIKNFGKKDGSYIIKESSHLIDRNNKHTTQITLQK